MLIEKGAKVKDWSELPDHIRPERDGTPAPWATKSSRLNEIFSPSTAEKPKRKESRQRMLQRKPGNINEYPPVSYNRHQGIEENRGRRGRSPRVDRSPTPHQSSRSYEPNQQYSSKHSLHDESRPPQAEATTVMPPSSDFSSGPDFRFYNLANMKPDNANIGNEYVHSVQRRRNRWLLWLGLRSKSSSVDF